MPMLSASHNKINKEKSDIKSCHEKTLESKNPFLRVIQSQTLLDKLNLYKNPICEGLLLLPFDRQEN